MDPAYTAAYPELYRHHWWWRVREDILIHRLRRIRAGLSPRARILDVGCGAGVFFDALEQFGHVEGIESDAEAVARSGGWRSRITLGQLDETYSPSEPFDLVLMLDLLEHVDDPLTLLSRVRKVLNRDGDILITVPAFEWLWTAHDELNQHVRRYTSIEIRHLIAQAGFKVQRVDYLFQSLVLPKLFTRAKEAIVGSAPRVPRMPAPWLNRALRIWYHAEHLIAGSLPFGSSLLVIGRL